MKQLFRTLTLCVLPLLVAACSTDYNFDKVSLEVTVGDTNGIVVPLGEIEKVTVGELLGESGLPADEEGNYGFSYGNGDEPLEYNIEVGEIAPITGLAPTIDPIKESLLNGFSAKVDPFIGTKEIGLPSELSSVSGTLTNATIAIIGDTFPLTCTPYTFEESFSIELPKEVASLEEVTFGADGNGSILDIQFDLGGLAGVTKECTINTLYFELPEGFVIDKLPSDPLFDEIVITNDNHFEISDYTFTGNHLTIDIVLKRVSFNHEAPDENNVVTVKEDVTFALDATIQVQEGEVEAVSPYVEMSVTPVIYDATILTNEITYDINFEDDIDKSIAVPEIVKEIHSLSISKANSIENALPQFSVEVALDGSPVDALELRDVEITLPSFLDIETPEGWNYNEGKLTADKLDILNGQTNHIIDLALRGINGLDIVDGEIALSSAIGLKATAAIASGSSLHINTSSAKELSLVPTITLDDLSITKVTGIIDPDLDDLLKIDPIVLGDFTSSLEGIELDLNIASPVLKLVVENPIGVGIDADLTLVAYKGEDVVSTLSVPELKILPAETTTIVINGEAAPDVPNHLTYQVDGFADMIAALPERIEVELSAETNREQPHVLTLQDSYTFKVEYSVEAAFKFDSEKEGHIDYTVDIEDVDLSALADIDVVVENLTLNVATESTLPIDLMMDIEFLDESGESIECIAPKMVGKIEGSTTAEAKHSECSVILDIKTEDGVSPFAEIAKTKKLRCHLSGTTLAGGALNANQYIAAKLSLELGEGITVDLGSLIPESETPEPTPDPEAKVE